MTINFDITETPPTVSTIDEARTQMAARLRRITHLGWTVLGLLALLGVGLWLTWYQDSMADNDLLVSTLAFNIVAVFVTGTVFVTDAGAVTAAVGMATVLAVGIVAAIVVA